MRVSDDHKSSLLTRVLDKVVGCFHHFRFSIRVFRCAPQAVGGNRTTDRRFQVAGQRCPCMDHDDVVHVCHAIAVP